jgi:hypothetical protein
MEEILRGIGDIVWSLTSLVFGGIVLSLLIAFIIQTIKDNGK